MNTIATLPAPHPARTAGAAGREAEAHTGGLLDAAQERTASFGEYVAAAAAAGRLVVQPRMGFSDPRRMREGLRRTRSAVATTVGTLTIDSYTRTGDLAAARAALAEGTPLNGYPIATHPPELTRDLLDSLRAPGFPVQVRHGSSRPEPIIRALTAAGLDATEGGPVSYCLPYGRTPLAESVDNWARSCELLATLVPDRRTAHVESFGGCMLGQLCPPGLLVALSLLEGLFFVRHGIRSISLSYAQQTDQAQDVEAVRALRRLAEEFLPADVDRHVVLYAYMGVFPRTERGATRLLEDAAHLAVRSGAARLIVKTAAEAHRIPTVGENVRALETAAAAAALAERDGTGAPADGAVYREARSFVEAVLELSDDPGRALRTAFARGVLDVPYCLHPDNAGRSRSFLAPDGTLRWSAVGRMPAVPYAAPGASGPMTSTGLLRALHTLADRYDRPGPPAARATPRPPAPPARPATPAPRTPPPSRPGDDMDATTPPALGEHLASPRLRSAMLVQQEALYAARGFLRGEGFVELLPPLVGPVTDPGGRGAKALDVDYYGQPYKLMTSAILYKQASLKGFPRLFYVAPNVRVEPPETAGTGRHLVEFHQIDVELADGTRKDAQDIAAGLLTHVVDHVWTAVPDVLRELGRDELDFAELRSGKFDTRTHDEAVARLVAAGHPQSPDAEIDWTGERLLSLEADRPFFVDDYPKGSRGFYDREDPERPGVLRNFDLLAHGGYGELASGSERESDYATIVTRMRESGENPAKYAWYLQLAREGIRPSAGFGMGLQRLVRFLTGLDSLWQVSAYPKLPGVIAP
ncbi:amino acid--tRNA ligase-related protein [Streptomyces sp. NPDC017943]|uniref:amino acid--tRNA ligase-related protein n=1 Tax=Streptomyces sp. NPDC017943 TaxID=3365019 RepID=UPI00379433F4